MEISSLFDNISQQSLLMLESLFVSRSSAQNYIQAQKRTNQTQKLDQFVLDRSDFFTQRSIKSTKMNLRTATQLPQHTQFHRARSAPSQSNLKKSHSLTFTQFTSALHSCLNAPTNASSSVFAQLCKGDPLTQSPIYAQILAGKLETMTENAASIFQNCEIFWLDLLNFITTKTTIIQQNNEIRLSLSKVPANFCHRLTVENCAFFPEIGVYFTSGRDGLAQFWSSSSLSDLMQFSSLEEMQFGMCTEEVESLVQDWTAESENTGLERIKNIQVLTGVVNGGISLENIKNDKKIVKNDIKLPFQLIFTLTDPKLDQAAFPLRQDTDNYSHDLVVACRRADAPLPSGRPMPEKVWNSIKFKGGIYNFAPEKVSKYGSGGGHTLYGDCKGFQRSKSMKIRRFTSYKSEKSINEMFDSAFSGDEATNFEFLGQQHPIFKQKRQVIGKMQQEQQEEIDSSDIENDLQKHRKLNLQNFKPSGKGNAWATASCYDADMRRFFISSAGGQILIFRILKSGLELSQKIRISAVGVRKIGIWDREITRLQVNRIQEQYQNQPGFDILDYVKGVSKEQIPGTGESSKRVKYVVVLSPAEICFINHKSLKVDLVLTVNDVAPEFPGQFFSTMGIFGDKLLFGMTNGYIIALDQFSLEKCEKLHVFDTEVSDMTFYYSSSLLIASCLNGKISIFNYESKPHLLQENHDSGCILNVFSSEKYEVFISICTNGVVTVWSAKQYNQVNKVFVNENVTISMWDEENGVLIVGNVWLKAYKIMGVKKDIKGAEKVEKSIPQAHYVEVVGVVNLGVPGNSVMIENPFLLEFDVECSDNIILSGKASPELVVKKQLKGVQKEVDNAYYHPLPFNRKEMIHRPKFYDETNPCQPNVQITDITPFSNPREVTQEPIAISSHYDKLHLQKNFAVEIQQNNFQMMNFDQYFNKVEIDLKHQDIKASFRRKKVFSKNQNSGQEIMQILHSKQDIIAEFQPKISGFVTIDVEGNLRHWEGQDLIATYQIELPDRVVVNSSGYDPNGQVLILNLSNGTSLLFKLITSEIQSIFNISNAAKAAYLLNFGQKATENGIETQEFTEYLKGYDSKKYDRITSLVSYNNQLAVACGEFILIYHQNQRSLSLKFVQNLLLSGAKVLRSLIPGMNNPPNLILRGHNAPIVSLSSAGKKMLSCDEAGVVCFWLGLGIAKWVVQLKEDYIVQCQASFHDDLWGYFLFKNGRLEEVGTDKQITTVLDYKITGNDLNIFTVSEAKNGRTYALSNKNCGFIFANQKLIASFKLPCKCKEIKSLDFNGFTLVFSCSGGHVFVSEIEQKPDSIYIQNGLEISLNINFDENFDSQNLLPCTPLSVNQAEKNQQASEINVETELFFERLAQSQLKIEKTLVLEQSEDVRMLSSKVLAESVQISNMLVNEDTIEVARREQMLSLRINFK